MYTVCLDFNPTAFSAFITSYVSVVYTPTGSSPPQSKVTSPVSPYIPESAQAESNQGKTTMKYQLNIRTTRAKHSLCSKADHPDPKEPYTKTIQLEHTSY